MTPHCPDLGRPLLIKHGGEDGQLGEGPLLGLGQGLQGEGEAGCLRAILSAAVEYIGMQAVGLLATVRQQIRDLRTLHPVSTAGS